MILFLSDIIGRDEKSDGANGVEREELDDDVGEDAISVALC